MSTRRRTRGRSAPPGTPPTADDSRSQDTDIDGDPSRRREDDGGATRSGGGSTVVVQEAMRAAVLEALSDPTIVRQFLSAVSSTPSVSHSAAASSARDGTSPLGEMPSAGEIASLGLASAGSGEDPLSSSTPTTESDAANGSQSQSTAAPSTTPTASGKPASASGSPATSGFSLGHGFPLIPAKLVSKIQKWEFVNLSELLPDNLELARRTSHEPRSTSPCSTVKSPKKRELYEDWKGLIAWSVCFNTFAAIVAKKHPAKSQELLAYHSTILVEALRFGCRGWMSYDRMFREHVEKEPESNWSLLHSMFYSLTFLSQRVEASTCPKCMGSDHSKSECALAALEPQRDSSHSRPAENARQPGPARKRFRRDPVAQSGTSNLGTSAAKSICFSFNEGQCFKHPKPCDREHKCIRCGGDHRMVDCKAAFVQSS